MNVLFPALGSIFSKPPITLQNYKDIGIGKQDLECIIVPDLNNGANGKTKIIFIHYNEVRGQRAQIKRLSKVWNENT